MSFISIEYDESGYKSVTVSDRDDKDYVFNTGDFPHDWYKATKKQVLIDGPSSASSSVNHFIWDNPGIYKSLYLLIISKEEDVEFQVTEDNEKLLYETSLGIQQHDWVEFFIPVDMSFSTWDEARAYLERGEDVLQVP